MAKKPSDDGPWDFPIGDGPGEVNVETALEVEREIAYQIAIFISLFSTAELLTPHVLAEVIGISDQQAEIILGSLISYSTRLKIIQALLPGKIKDQATAQNVALMVSELVWLNAERNRYVHAQYSKTGSLGELRRYVYFTDAARETQEGIITAEIVKIHIIRAKRLLRMLWQTLRPSRASPNK